MATSTTTSASTSSSDAPTPTPTEPTPTPTPVEAPAGTGPTPVEEPEPEPAQPVPPATLFANEPANVRYGAAPTGNKISDSAWQAAVGSWMDRHVKNSPIAQNTDAYNHLSSIADNLRDLLEIELRR